MFCDKFLNEDASDRKQLIKSFVLTASQKIIMSKFVYQSLYAVTNHEVKNITHYSTRIKNQCQMQILQQTLAM